MTKITFNDFVKEYEPEESKNGLFFDIKHDRVKALQASIEHRCWTLLDIKGILSIQSGRWLRNRVEYLITRKPWSGKKGNIKIEY